MGKLEGKVAWPGREHARPSFGFACCAPPTWQWLLLAAARGLAGQSRLLLLQPKLILLAYWVVPC